MAEGKGTSDKPINAEGSTVSAFRRFPQKIPLEERPGSKSLWLLPLLLFIPGTTVILFLHIQGVAAWLLGMLFVLLLIACQALKKLAEFILPTLILTMGWCPSIEVFPAEGQIVISDVTGIADLFKPDSRITIYRESLVEVQCHSAEANWRVELITRKKDRIPILSSSRKSRTDAEDLAKKISRALEIPYHPSDAP
ncbi:MAG: hypothetical protein WA705_00365 [Candidatus Ozemobacteraceae bacterium]